MQTAYDPKTIRELERLFEAQEVRRPFRLHRYEPGEVLEYDVRGVFPDAQARVRLEVEKFAGGGYAGQVYKVRVIECRVLEGSIPGLASGDVRALKILVPPSGIGRRIRNLFYFLGFQGPFSLQSIAAAGRSQALWQKFIRRAARSELGAEDAVVDIIGTLVDARLGSCGEISEWVDGRVWRFEVDNDLDSRRAWKPGGPDTGLGSPEYRTKREFMARLVRLLHDIGATELARQYEWWSLKSQPNALKRTASDPNPKAGLVAVDFRAGMTLTPVNPQCPVDFKLIARGVARGRLAQFDKGDLRKLEAYVNARPAEFADMRGALEELKREDAAYRDSLIDITYHRARLFGRRLRRAIMNGFRESWRVRNFVDDGRARVLEKNGLRSFLFLVLGALPALSPFALAAAVVTGRWWMYPLAAAFLAAAPIRRLWGRADLRRHYARMLTNPRYFLRAGRARIAEALIRWVRKGRVSEERALMLGRRPWRYYLHAPLSILPPGLHRFLTDKAYFKARLKAMFVQPVRLYFRAEEREKWLRDMIAAGEGKGMLSREEAGRIIAQIKEPFIQKYLKSLAVHVCTLPITQVVSVLIAFIYVKTHPELSWQQASVAAGLILGLFQVVPISPGSFARGLYTTGLVLRERNFKDYKMAFAISYFKYIGYLAFPLQMAYRYPELARFMAGHWSTGAVHIVPVFGEKGAWLEHFVFDTFYNFPLTIQRRMKLRAERRKNRPSRSWHAPLLAIGGALALAGLDDLYFRAKGVWPDFADIWWAAAWIPFLSAWLTARWAGGAAAGKRIGWAILGAIATGILAAAAGYFLAAAAAPAAAVGLGAAAFKAAWQAFLFALIAAVAALIAETRRVR
jgi:hypothetical protein